MTTVTLTLTVTPEKAKSILASLASTGPASTSEAAHTQKPAAGKSATGAGRGTTKAAEPEETDSDEAGYEDFGGDDTDAADEPADVTVPEVQKLMATFARKNGPEKAKKILAKYKVKKVAELSQAKLNQLAAEVSA